MKKIKLSKGEYTLVDDEDFEYLNQWKWSLLESRGAKYAMRNDYSNGVKSIKMHRLIMNLNSDNKELVDHIDNDGLNNQKVNLRLATRRQNSLNRKSWKKSSSIYLGVNFHKHSNKWVARIRTDNKRLNLGSFKTEQEAAIAYNLAAIIHHKEYANLNTI